MSDDIDKITNYTEADNPKYKGHAVFSSLDKFVSFYKIFSYSVMFFSTTGTDSIISIDTRFFSSIQGTLESINMILKAGRLGDAFALLRKYHDLIVVNLYTNLYLENNIDMKKYNVKEINDWLMSKEKLPQNRYRSMYKYIEKSEKFESLFKVIHKDKSYKDTRRRCNDYMHYNHFYHVVINDNELVLSNRIEVLNLFNQDLDNLFILHVCSLFYFNDLYMLSSNYMDELEMGGTPDEEMLKWVSPFVQEIFSELIEIKRPDLAKIIKDQTSMNLS